MANFFMGLIAVVIVIGVIGGIVGGLMVGLPKYGIYRLEHRGEAALREAALREAEHSRKIRIEEAKALKESALFQAQAEIERARGVAEANQIIGDSLKGNDAYLRYLWIQGLHDGSSETIYVPTEANLPILEAMRGAR